MRWSLAAVGVLDPRAVAAARHAQARVARPVELRPRLLGDPVDDRARVAPLDGRIVDVDGAAGGSEAARIPGHDVVALRLERHDERIVRRRAAVGPAGAHQHGRRWGAGGQGVWMHHDRRAVERRDDGIVGPGRARGGQADQRRDAREDGLHGCAARAIRSTTTSGWERKGECEECTCSTVPARADMASCAAGGTARSRSQIR